MEYVEGHSVPHKVCEAAQVVLIPSDPIHQIRFSTLQNRGERGECVGGMRTGNMSKGSISRAKSATPDTSGLFLGFLCVPLELYHHSGRETQGRYDGEYVKGQRVAPGVCKAAPGFCSVSVSVPLMVYPTITEKKKGDTHGENVKG